jgi:hypothetical protein
VIEALLLAYLVVALVTATAAWALSSRLGHDRRPAANPVPVSLIAGLLWPLVLVGALEIWSLALLNSAIGTHRGIAVHA